MLYGTPAETGQYLPTEEKRNRLNQKQLIKDGERDTTHNNIT